MGKTVAQTINGLMPSAMDKTDSVYRAFIADENTDTGALTNEVKDAISFIDYYTRTQSVNDSEGNLLEFIISLFTSISRNYSEPDDYLRLRYKALVERKRNTHWNGKTSIRDVFTYFFDAKNIYLVERYPTNNLVANGDFDTLDNWTYNNSDTQFKLIYSRSFENGAAILVNPEKANPLGYMEQKMSAVTSGLYELIFFFSSSKHGAGDVAFTLRDKYGKYWNGSSWIQDSYLFYEAVDEATTGYYKKVQCTVSIPNDTDIYLRFQNRNGNGCLIDSVRFGPVEDPAMRVYITATPELFHNAEITYAKRYNHNGFRKFYIQTDMESILDQIRPAGVHAEMTILSSRLNIPWDRVLLAWNSTLSAFDKMMHDGSYQYKYGTISQVTRLHDESIKHDSALKYDGIELVRGSKATDKLYGSSLHVTSRTYKRRFRECLSRELYHDERMGYNSAFDHTGEQSGVVMGLSTMRVRRNVVYDLSGIASYDRVWGHASAIKHDGVYTYYQTAAETYLVKEA